MRDQPGIQIGLLFYLSILYQSYLIIAKPFLRRSDQAVAIFNEICVTLYLYPTILLTDFVPSSAQVIKEKGGLSIIGVLLLSFTVNLIVIAFSVYNEI